MLLEDAKKLVLSLNQTYWFSHQSPKTCLLGSDGTGHDFIHPMDKLQAACRNAYSMINAIEDMWDEQSLLSLDMKELGHVDNDRNKVICRQKKRRIDSLELQIQERLIALETYYVHIKELLPALKDRFKDYDSALTEIWLARIAYNSFVKSHPLGQDLKIALMPEADKSQALSMIEFPTEFNGQPLPIPNADYVLDALEKYLKEKKECQKITGSSSVQETQL